MCEITTKFVNYCKNNLNFNDQVIYHYKSLSVCIIDCVYSLNVDYDKITKPLVKKYADKFLNGDVDSPDDTISMLYGRLNTEEKEDIFENQIMNNHNKLGGKAKIPKVKVVAQLAKYLKCIHVETISDFNKFECQDLLEIIIKSVDGMGEQGTNYLFMLAGDNNRCKADLQVHRFIKAACGEDLSDSDCQSLFTKAVEILQKDYPQLDERTLDGLIWNTQRKKK